MAAPPRSFAAPEDRAYEEADRHGRWRGGREREQQQHLRSRSQT
jgi:hypothetical protein